MICAEGLSLPRGFTNRRFSWVRSGRFSKAQMMRTSVFDCASLNKDAQIIHHGHAREPMKQHQTKSLATKIGTVSRNMPTNFKLKQLNLK